MHTYVHIHIHIHHVQLPQCFPFVLLLLAPFLLRVIHSRFGLSLPEDAPGSLKICLRFCHLDGSYLRRQGHNVLSPAGLVCICFSPDCSCAPYEWNHYFLRPRFFPGWSDNVAHRWIVQKKCRSMESTWDWTPHKR